MKWLVATLLLSVSPGLLAQDDEVPGAQDHPLLTRYPDSRILEYEKNYNSVEFSVAGASGQPSTKTAVEGDMTAIRYFHNIADRQPSALQVLRNYQNAIKQIGGTVAYERLPQDGDGGETTLRVTTGGKDVWIKVVPDIYGAPTQSYQLVFVETAAMTQVVSANQMLDELNKNGFIALYINFDTGKAELKPDGLETVREIVTLMSSNPGLNLSVEGHTDNTGTPASNKALSLARANSVMNAIVADGISSARLTAAGFGQESPVADNRTEEGRAQNRRVELVKR
jgi:outer membrane protein OmpA-like peptidoglycan-associated protein